MGVVWSNKHAERRIVSRRSASPRVALGGAQRAGATSQRGFVSRCQAVLAGPSARELGQDCPASYGAALAALERIYRRHAA